MAKKRVYVFSGTHPIYESILKFPPKNVAYSSNVSLSDFSKAALYKKSHEKKKRIVSNIFKFFRIPRIIYLPEAKNADLILSTRGFLVLNKKPWLVEIEHADSFQTRPENMFVKQMLSSKRCKKIISRCNAVTLSLLNKYDCKKFKHKIEEILPTIPPAPKFKKKKNRKTTLLFTSAYPSFFRKGGQEVLKAFSILEKKYDVKLIMRAGIPEEIKKKYTSKNIEFIDKMIPHSQLYHKLYSRTDIFVLPTFIDAFGITYLEAMSAGIPCVGTDIFAVPEIIEDGKNGFLIHSPISDYLKNGLHRSPKLKEDQVARMNLDSVVKQLVKKISILLRSGSLRRKMGAHGKKMIETGKFSIKERNKKLERIFEEAASS